MIGAEAYWNETHASAIGLRYQDAYGEWQSEELGTATVSADNNQIQFIKSAEIPVDGLVEVRIKKADTKIHLISWLAVAKEPGVDPVRYAGGGRIRKGSYHRHQSDQKTNQKRVRSRR